MTVRNQLRAVGRGLELANVVEAYLLTCRAEGKSPNTIRWYEQKLRTFLEYLRSRRLPLNPSDITPEIVRGLIAHLQASDVSAFTTRGYVQVVKGLFTWLDDEGYIEDNPIRRVKLPWDWGLSGALAVFILMAGIVLLIERDRIVSIQIGAPEGTNMGVAFQPAEAIVLPGPGEEVEISAFISGVEAITEPSTCRLTVAIPGEEPLRTGPEAVSEDGTISWSIPSDEFATVGKTPLTADVTADCDVSGEEFAVSTELEFVSE